MSTAPCGYCGEETDGYHSGVQECRSCWNWRKLDGPAAAHWAKVARAANDGLTSNIDMYDLMTYIPRALGPNGNQRLAEALDTIRDLAEHAEAELSQRRALPRHPATN